MSKPPAYSELEQQLKGEQALRLNFMKLVLAMREAQKRYIKTHSSLALEQARKYETMVDRVIKQYKAPVPKQGEIF